MSKQYLEAKAKKKKSALKAVWVLAALGLIFVLIIVKFAQNAGISFTSGGLPSGGQAYEVAQDFVKSTVRSNSISFPSGGYEFAKRSDSVYVIRSAVELTDDNGERRKTSFKLLMQYNGGKQDELKNWSLLNISEQ